LTHKVDETGVFLFAEFNLE